MSCLRKIFFVVFLLQCFSLSANEVKQSSWLNFAGLDITFPINSLCKLSIHNLSGAAMTLNVKVNDTECTEVGFVVLENGKLTAGLEKKFSMTQYELFRKATQKELTIEQSALFERVFSINNTSKLALKRVNDFEAFIIENKSITTIFLFSDKKQNAISVSGEFTEQLQESLLRSFSWL